MGWGRSAWLAAILLVFAVLSATAAEPKRVLFLRSFGRDVPPYDTFTAQLRTDLAARSPAPLDFYEVPLEIARFGAGQQEAKFVDYLLALSADHPPDIVVPIGAPAVRFAQRLRRQLFPSTPLLFAAVDERMLQDPALTANDAVVPVSIDVPGLIENILRVQPQTTTVAVAIGNSPVEKLWVEDMRREFDPFARRVEILYFNQLPFEETLTRAAALPPHSAILYADVQMDGHGVPRSEEQTLGGLRAVANAPIFGLYDYQLGRGIVGGSLVSVRRLSRDTADVAERILRGESPGQFRTPALRSDAPVFDSRELQRWGIAEANLPPNSIVRFRQPTLWEQYRWYIIAAAAFSGLEAVLIVALLLNRRRLRRAHEDLKASEERMSLAAAAGNLGFWVWDIPRDEAWASATDWSLALWDPAKPIKFDQGLQAAHADDRDLIRRAIQRAIHGDGDYRVEFRVPLPDSTIRWIAARGRVELDGKGQPFRMRGVSIDITERRRAEEEAHDLSGRLISAQEDERARLARALHDDITQRLALLAIDTGRKESGFDEPAAKQAMRSMRRDLAQISEDVHALCYALHPAILQDLGLIEALRAECDRFRSVEAIPVNFRAEENLDEPPRQVALCLYRIAQEALRNVARHASASAIDVGLRFVDNGLQLSVRDNGIGFDPARKQARPSLGHASMRQRVSLVGGELRLVSIPGHGTTVQAWAPLNKEAHRESSTGVVG